MGKDNKLELLKKFVVDTTVFDELNQYSSTGLNYFEITGMIRREVKHSQFLAWLMDPLEKHNIGDQFIKKILETIDISLIESLSEIQIIDLLLNNYNDLTVQKEYVMRGESRRIDILAISEENKTVICIENKVFSNEHDDQLQEYQRIINSYFSEDYTKIFIFLTPNGDESSDSNAWISLSYEQIADILEKLQLQLSNQKVENIIYDYIEILRRHIVQNDELEQLARKIYKKHKDVFDLIYEKAYAAKSTTIVYVDTALEKLANEGLIIFDQSFSSSAYKRFRTQKMDTLFPYEPAVSESGWSTEKTPNSTYYYEITSGNNSAWRVCLEFSPWQLPDATLRKMEKIGNKPNGMFNPSNKYRATKKWAMHELDDIEADSDEELQAIIEISLRNTVKQILEWESTL